MIFNLFAIIPVAITVLICMGFHWLSPELIDGTYGNLIVGVTTTAVGSVCELLGIRGRIFFIPIWFIGIVMVGFQLYHLWGILGLIVSAILIVSCIVFIYKKAKQSELKNWKTAQDSIEKFSDVDSLTDTLSFWKDIREGLFFPIFKDYDTEVCSHNLAITDVILHVTGDQLSDEDLIVWNTYREFLNNNIENNTSEGIDSDLQNAVNDFVTAKCDSFADEQK